MAASTVVNPAAAAAAAAASAALIAQQFAARLTAQRPVLAVDPKTRLKQLVDQIPTKRAELFAYPVAWAVVDKHGLVDSVMRPWLVKKIVEFLGEEEESLTSFVVTSLRSHCAPTDLLEELSMVLDDDSEQFVLKLWRMLIYHTLVIQSQS